jgi:glyoxylase-like metal-dependent hydrolase (beta-lactamase superfamily II)
MLSVLHHGQVLELRFTTWRSRSIGYSVSAYFARGVLIDCGFPDAARDVERIARELRPDGAIITHGHEDHGANVDVLARLGVPLAMAPDTLAELRAGKRIRFYRSYTWGQPRPFSAEFQPFDPAPLQVIATPGHCADHHIVWDAAHGTLYSADLWLGVRDKLVHAEEDPRQLLRDLRAAAALEPESMFDAHRGPVREPVRALNAKAQWLDDMIGTIDRRIAEGWSDRAILRRVVGGEVWTGFVSRGEYSRRNFVRNLRRTHTAPR